MSKDPVRCKKCDRLQMNDDAAWQTHLLRHDVQEIGETLKQLVKAVREESSTTVRT